MNKNKLHKGTVKTLDNDYVRSNANVAKQQQMKQRQKVLSRRRLAVFFVVAAAVCIVLVSTIVNQNARLAEKEAQKRSCTRRINDRSRTERNVRITNCKATKMMSILQN